jgi:hypothetical protein
MFRPEEERIINKYKFFHPEKPLSESLMAFGFACDEGWFGIIENMCEKLSKIVPEDFEILQVKQKFATLRVYPNIFRDDIEAIINEAETESETTCEICGSKEGKLDNTGGWWKTVCTNCEK